MKDKETDDYLVEQKIVLMDVDKLVPYDRNAKLHDNMVSYLKNHIKKVKFRNPIYVDQDNVIIEGHARRLAAIALGMEKVPVIVVKDLDPDEVRLMRLADNRIAELSDYDLDILGLEMAELKADTGWDLEDFGLDFDFESIEELSEFLDDAEGEDEDAEVLEFDSSAIKETVADPTVERVPDEPFIKVGDVVLMGRHRLVCGDATDIEVVRLALDGATADICFTSPPYNAGHIKNVRTPREGPKYIDTEDLRDYGDYEEFIFDVVDNLMATCEEVFLNMGLLAGSKTTIVHLLNKYLGSFKDLVYWRKSNPVPAVKDGVISSSMELIICLGRNGSRQFRHKHGIWYGVIEGTIQMHNNYKDVHKATFPLYLPTEVVRVFTEEDDLVLDCFAGTGTTMIACCDLDRRCAMVEKVPLYCDIIARRYAEHTGDRDIRVMRDGKELRYPLRHRCAMVERNKETGRGYHPSHRTLGS